MVADGFFGSKFTVPEMSLPVPLIDSRGASSIKAMLLTPLASLKSKTSAEAPAQEVKTKKRAKDDFFIVYIVCDLFFRGCV